jgi:hypothetical protein
MSRAYVRVADLRFPERCVRCGRAPEAAQDLVAWRGADLVVFAAWDFLDIPVPICHRCRRIRRVAGTATWIGTVGGFFLCSFLAFSVMIDGGSRVAASAFGALALTLLVTARALRDGLLEWWTLGMRAKILWSDESILRFSIRRPDYRSAWMAANPGATLSPHTLQNMPKNVSETSPLDPALGRKLPAIAFLGSAAGIAWHHWNVVTNQTVYSKLFLLFTLMAGWSLAGLLDPRVFWSVGKYGRHLATKFRVLAFLAAAAGFGAGMWALLTVYGS